MLTNQYIAVRFDLDGGTFSVADSRSGEPLLDRAAFADSLAGGAALRLFREDEVADALGRGKRVVLAFLDHGLPGYFSPSEKRNKPPERLISFTLHDNSPALILGFGLRTEHYFSMRLTECTVLGGRTIFGGREIARPLTLNGGAGADPTTVEEGLSRIACNSLMLTGLVDGRRRTAVWGGLANQAFAKMATLRDGVPGLFAKDPVGVLVDEEMDYLAGDTFYLDLVTREPFAALERYGQAMRAVNRAAPQVYDFPVVCGWSVGSISKLPDINNSAKLVAEADQANACGLTRYTPVALRLEPDKYHVDTEQGWWDDEHFRTFGHLAPPYETLATWCAALAARHAVPYIYMQLGMPSDDFARAHPEYMLFNDASEVDRQSRSAPENRKHRHHMPFVTYDYTDNGFSAHFVKVWSAIRQAGVKGVKIDYPETAWRPEGGFDDRYASTCSAYRRAFELMREAMGPDGLIDERNLGESSRPCLDVTAGIVDTQRTWGDSNKFVPEMVSRSGLRWYKNRVVFNYYSDTKAVHGLSAGRLQSLVTMNFLTSGRLDLATSFALFDEQITRIVSRSYPHYPEAKTARPLDAFTGVRDPQVYDLELTPDWHQIAFYNTGDHAAAVSTAISGDRVDNAVGLDAGAEYHAYEFWSDTYLGRLPGTSRIERELEPECCAMISLRKAQPHPQVVSTSRHLLQGWVDLPQVAWDADKRILGGTARVVGGEPFRIVVARNGFAVRQAAVDTGTVAVEPHPDSKDLSCLVFECATTADVRWEFSLR